MPLGRKMTTMPAGPGWTSLLGLTASGPLWASFLFLFLFCSCDAIAFRIPCAAGITYMHALVAVSAQRVPSRPLPWPPLF